MYQVIYVKIGLSTFIRIVVSSLYFPFFIFFSLSIFKKKAFSLIVAIPLLIGYFVCILAYMIYHAYFGSLPHIRMISTKAQELPYILDQIFSQLVSFREIAVIVLGALSIICLIQLPGRFRMSRVKSLCLVSALFFICIGQTQCHYYLNSTRNLPDVHKMMKYNYVAAFATYGYLPFLLEQAMQLVKKANKTPVAYPGSINNGNRNNEMKRLPGHNVIIIQVESLDNWIFDLTIDQQYIMPFLHHLKKESVYFENFFAQHSGGGSADAELSSLTGLLPLQTHLGLSTADYAKLSPLPRVLSQKGYHSAVMHANIGYFFNRNITFPQLGFQKTFFSDSYKGEASGWNSKDTSFFKQSATMISKLDHPFFVYMITMQSHGPFKNNENKFRLGPEWSGSDRERDYLQTMHEVDMALSVFFKELEVRNLLEKTIFIIFSDHQSGVATYSELRKESIPLLIYNPSLSPYSSRKLGSHIDISPTVLDLLGIEGNFLYLGDSLFTSGPGSVLFNDLTLVERGSGNLSNKFSLKHHSWVEYSKSLLE